MILRIDLSPELEDRLKQAATKAGMHAEEYAAHALERCLRSNGNTEINSLLDSWTREDATDDPTELAARQDSLNELKEALNANRNTERRLFP